LNHPHNSNPRPANAAALLKQEEAATSAAGAFDADSSGSEAMPSSGAGLHQQLEWLDAQ